MVTKIIYTSLNYKNCEIIANKTMARVFIAVD